MLQRRKILTLLVSLLAAVVLWLYVVSVVAPEASTRVSGIPINIDGTIVLEERGLIITAQNVNNLALEVSTSRVNLSKLNADSIRVNADASRIRSPGQYDLSCTVTFPDTVRTGEVNVLRKSVDAVTITVERLEKKTFPIQLNWTGSVKEGYFFETGGSSMDPAEVVVYGTEDEVAKIARVVVDYDVSDLEETVIRTVPLRFLDANDEEIDFSDLTEISVTQTDLTLSVLGTRELTLALDYVEGGGVTAENADVKLDPETIRVKGPADVLESLENPFIIGTVDLAAISDSDYEEATYPLNLPTGVENIGGETEIHGTIRLTGVSSDTVSVSNIQLINVPEGYVAEAATKTVRVTVRGSTEEINEILRNKDNGIYIQVDLADYSRTGAFPVVGKVVNPNHPSISVAENVEINVSMSLASDSEN